ncbi:hypothetical protein BGZ63DRAFT_260041 [Mariannaea sp. PMI_226]|nr:hypothetical protein BGZ63DRAFT_260041 [Mariannaea sp. PMI_226]
MHLAPKDKSSGDEAMRKMMTRDLVTRRLVMIDRCRKHLTHNRKMLIPKPKKKANVKGTWCLERSQLTAYLFGSHSEAATSLCMQVREWPWAGGRQGRKRNCLGYKKRSTSDNKTRTSIPIYLHEHIALDTHGAPFQAIAMTDSRDRHDGLETGDCTLRLTRWRS